MAVKKNDITVLKEELNKNKLRNMYVFYGDEEYLKELSINKIIDMVPDGGLEEFNRIRINGQVSYSEYDEAFEGMPMMVDKRIILIRDSNIFMTRRSGNIVPPDDSQKKFWIEKFSRLSDDTVVIFCEKNVDARSAVFKAAGKAGLTIKCEYLSESDLKAWVIKNVMSAGKKINDDAARYLIAVVDPGLNILENELNKLLNYCEDTISISDIDRVVSKALQVQVFEITDGILEGNTQKVFKTLEMLRTQKQSAFGLLYLIYSNVEKMLHVRLANASNRNEAAAALGVSSWLAQKYLNGARGFSMDTLYHMVTRVPEIDYEIKSGLIGEWQALEQYIFEALEKKGKQR